jgi:hypothetical protein
MLALKDKPDWFAAAQSLVDGCATLENTEERVRFIQRVCLDLGDDLYPALLKILCIVGQHADEPARQVVAAGLVDALMTGRLPSGHFGAWGASNAALVRVGFGRGKSLGPIEYLCAWYAQPSGRPPLSATSFDAAASSLLALVGTSDKARNLYCAKLRADAADPLDGVLSRETRQALGAMALAWEQGAAPQAAIDLYVSGLQKGSGLDRLRAMHAGGINFQR